MKGDWESKIQKRKKKRKKQREREVAAARGAFFESERDDRQ